MKERPINLKAHEVRAILSGSKTQTRRALRHQIDGPGRLEMARPGFCSIVNEHGARIPGFFCPFGAPGDRLWVRETFAHIYTGNAIPDARRPDDVVYRAEGHGIDTYAFGPWCSSVHMPRWASRILLEVTDVRVERLHDISEADARAEGFTNGGCRTCGESEPCGCYAPQPDPRQSFVWQWEKTFGPESWPANSWVWAVTFRRIEP